MPLPLPDPYVDDQSIRRNFEALAAGIVQRPLLVTSLPSSPTDGLEVYYVADDTNGVIWHLRYRSDSASSYKWEFVGGSGLTSTDVAARALSTASYNPPTGSALTAITPPLTGEYKVRIHALHVDASGWWIKTAPRYNGGSADTALEIITGTGANNSSWDAYGEFLLTLTAGQSVTLEHATGNTVTPSNSSVSRRSMSVEPVRVS